MLLLVGRCVLVFVRSFSGGGLVCCCVVFVWCGFVVKGVVSVTWITRNFIQAFGLRVGVLGVLCCFVWVFGLVWVAFCWWFSRLFGCCGCFFFGCVWCVAWRVLFPSPVKVVLLVGRFPGGGGVVFVGS